MVTEPPTATVDLSTDVLTTASSADAGAIDTIMASASTTPMSTANRDLRPNDAMVGLISLWSQGDGGSSGHQRMAGTDSRLPLNG
jgi:hypothetical protein